MYKKLVLIIITSSFVLFSIVSLLYLIIIYKEMHVSIDTSSMHPSISKTIKPVNNAFWQKLLKELRVDQIKRIVIIQDSTGKGKDIPINKIKNIDVVFTNTKLLYYPTISKGKILRAYDYIYNQNSQTMLMLIYLSGDFFREIDEDNLDYHLSYSILSGLQFMTFDLYSNTKNARINKINEFSQYLDEYTSVMSESQNLLVKVN